MQNVEGKTARDCADGAGSYCRQSQGWETLEKQSWGTGDEEGGGKTDHMQTV